MISAQLQRVFPSLFLLNAIINTGLRTCRVTFLVRKPDQNKNVLDEGSADIVDHSILASAIQSMRDSPIKQVVALSQKGIYNNNVDFMFLRPSSLRML